MEYFDVATRCEGLAELRRSLGQQQRRFYLDKVDHTSDKCREPHHSTGRIAAANRPDSLLLVLIALLSGYVVAGLTPSSYAVALPVFGAAPRWISLGEPREVRSDEWAVCTPYMQATVWNQFRRSVGPSLSSFPWVVLAAMLRHGWWKYVLFVYVLAARHDNVKKYLWYGAPAAIALLSFWFFALSEGG